MMMDNIVKKIEAFLAFSDKKLAELQQENQKVKEESQYIQKKLERSQYEKIISGNVNDFFSDSFTSD